jgi:hypothetical protein
MLSLGGPTLKKIKKSLDRFGVKNILFMNLFFIKQSRLATIRNMVRISNVRDWHKIESGNRPQSGFRMFTVLSGVDFIKQFMPYA